jgi:DNA-binding IclR family transcriptional regulator
VTTAQRFTPTQRAVIDALRALTTPLDGPPSTSAIAAHVGVRSRNTVWYALRQLQELGVVKRVHRGRYLLSPEHQWSPRYR